MTFLYALAVILFIMVLIYWTLRTKIISHRPKHFPQTSQIDKTEIGDQTIVVCSGDSITHGNMGGNYVEMLESKLPDNQYYLINAGCNADLTFTILKRLDNIIGCQPDIITLLIGSNDVNASMSDGNRKHYERLKKIDKGVQPDFENFKQNYSQIVQRLTTETKARIAVISLPVMSEDLEHQVNKRADEYSDFIKQIAKEQHIDYLPVREQMKEYIEKRPKKLKYTYEQTDLIMNLAVVKNVLFGQSWDTICEANGNDLTHDNLHFNTRGAAIIGALVEKFILLK
jgi:lysophospholipase L1-like esterase